MQEVAPSAEGILAELTWLRALARRLVRDPHQAEDAVQDAVVTALSRRPPCVASLRGWLAAVLRNAVRQEQRASERRAEREARVACVEVHQPTPLDVVAELGWHRRVVALVHELEEPYRTAIAWRFLHGRSVREIARQLDVPPKTVHTRIERGIARLRARLDREGGSRNAWLAALLPLAQSKSKWLGSVPGAWMVAMSAKPIVVGVVGIVLLGGLLYLPFRRSASPPAQLAHAAAGSQASASDESGVRQPAESFARDAVVVPPPAALTEPPPQLTQPAVPAVAGVVLDMQGRAVAEIDVQFVPSDDAASPPGVRTANDGTFELPLPQGRGSLTVEDAQYASVVSPFLDGSPPPVPPTIVVAPRRQYAGRVVDARGAPVAGAVVEATLDGPWLGSSALGFPGAGGQTVHLLLPLAETKSDAHGAFGFTALGLVEGAHLAAQRDGFAPGRLELPEQSRQDLVVVLADAVVPERALRGTVIDVAGAPVADALVSLGGGSVLSAPDGGFTLALEDWQKAGTLRAVKRGHLPAELEVEWSAARAETPITLQLGPAPLAIRGRVVDANGAPVAGAAVWSPDSTYFGKSTFEVRGMSILGETTVEALVTGDSGGDNGPRHQIETRTDEDGRFELAGLMPRGYAVYALEPSTLAAAAPVVVEAGNADLVLRLEGNATRRIAGRVVSKRGLPLADVRVCVGRNVPWADAPPPRTRSWDQGFMRAPSGSQAFLEPLTHTDAEGRFELAGLVVEGSYLVLMGAPIVLSEHVQLGAEPDLEELEIRVEACARFCVVLTDPNEADAFKKAPVEDSRQPLFVEVEGHVISTPQVAITEGRSGIAQTSEGPIAIVLLKDGKEVRRFETDLAPGGVHELRP